MDLMSGDAINAFGLLISEAIERLVDSHDGGLDKSAAMLTTESPTLSREGAVMTFAFKVTGNRQAPAATAVSIVPEGLDADDADYDLSPLDVTLKAVPACQCDVFTRDKRCPHSLAAVWWLQEQMSRRSISDVLEFLGDLEVDSVAAGRELIDDLLRIAADSVDADTTGEATRIQWRIGLPQSRYYSPISITPYEQKPRKNGKGWTKGKETRSFDLLRRDFADDPIDGRVAALVAKPSYSFEEDHFGEFRALQTLVGHDSVAWDDADATLISVHAAELNLTLEPVEIEDDADDDAPTEKRMKFRPRLAVTGIKIDFDACQVVLGHASPVDPVVVLADTKYNRLVICTLQTPRATRLIQFLLRTDFSDTLMDAADAAKFTVSSGVIDSLVRVQLPSQLAGPIQPVTAELVMELRPRPARAFAWRLPCTIPGSANWSRPARRRRSCLA